MQGKTANAVYSQC